MAKTFRPWDVEQRWLLPPSVNELVPEDHVAHFIRDTFRDELDLSEIMSAYGEERGFPPFHPVMMSALLMYAYCTGYFAEANLRALKRRRIRGYITSTKERMKAKPSQRRAPAQSELAREMCRRLDRGGYRSRYRLRKQIVEPVFGQVKHGRRFDRFSMRGREACRAEWALVSTASNLLKLARR